MDSDLGVSRLVFARPHERKEIRRPRNSRRNMLALAGASLAVCSIVLGASSTALASAPLNLTVNSRADTHAVQPGSGRCADAQGHCTLRAALEVANAQAAGRLVNIAVPMGTYKLTLGSLVVKHDAVVVKGASATGTVVNAQAASRVVSVSATAHVTVQLLELTNGNAGTFAGGGLFNAGNTTLNNVTVRANTAAQGGGISNAAGARLALANSKVSANTISAVADSSPGGSAGGIENAGSLTLTGATISGNRAGLGGYGGSDTAGPGGNGGGIANSGTVTATNSVISGNSAGTGGIGLSGQEVSGQGGSGGGIYSSGSVTLTQTVVSGNTSGPAGPLGEGSANAGDGGGVWSGGTLVVNGSTFSTNSGGQASGLGANGGGIYTSGTATISSSTFSSNTAGQGGGSGGGIASSGTLTLSTSTLSGNAAGAGVGGGYGGAGGGLAVNAGTSTLTGDTVSSNASGAGGNAIFVDPGCARPGPGGDGGGIYSTATLTMANSTLSGNTTGPGGSYEPPCAGNAPPGVGGGLATAGGSAALSYVTVADNSDGIENLAGVVTLGGTIVADSTGANCTGTMSETSGLNLDSGTSCGLTLSTDITGTEPLLGSLSANGGPTQTQALLSGSPAIDHGGTSSAGCPATDQRGLSRPDETGDNGTCDIGAYESQGIG